MPTFEDRSLTRSDLSAKDTGWMLDTPPLALFKRDEQDAMIVGMRERTYRRGAILARIGEQHDGVHFIIEGQAAVYAPAEHPTAQAANGQDEDGLEVVAHVGPGSLIGETSLALSQPATATVKAQGVLRAFFVDRETFQDGYARSAGFKAYVDNLARLHERAAALTRLLAENPLLRALGPDDVARLLQKSWLLQPARGAAIVEAGDFADSVFVAVSGPIHIHEPSADGGIGARLHSAKPGDLVGHIAVLTERPRTAYVLAGSTAPAELLRVNSQLFMDIVDHNPIVRSALDRSLAALDPRQYADLDAVRRSRLLYFVSGTGLDREPVAYGLASVLARSRPVVLVDPAGEATARRLKLATGPRKIGGISAQGVTADLGWGFELVWPTKAGDVEPLVEELLEISPGEEPRLVLLVAPVRETDAYRRLHELADIVLQYRRADQERVHHASGRGQLYIQIIEVRTDLEAPIPLPFRLTRKSVRLLKTADETARRRQFWTNADLDELLSERGVFGRAIERLGRLVEGRSVGLALGGGGAFGAAHIGLIRTLLRVDRDGNPQENDALSDLPPLPIDYVSGVSAGSLVGALFAGGGVTGLKEMENHGIELLLRCSGAVFKPSLLSGFVDKVMKRMSVAVTEIPFFPVGLNLTSGREYVLSHGTLGDAVESASCIPGVYPALRLGPVRLVDGGLINNVPVSTLWDAGADFIIGSNIVPPNPEGASAPFGNRALARIPGMGLLARVDDSLRAIYGLMSQIGRDRSGLADYLFDLSLEGYGIYDFPKARAIAQAGEVQARKGLRDIHRAYGDHRAFLFDGS